MTAKRPAPEPLYVSDEDLAALVGVDEEALGVAIRMLDRNPKSGFPQRDPMFGNKRYLPKVKEWFDNYNRTAPVTIRDRKSA